MRAEALKQRYQREWGQSNRRELLVLRVLEVLLPKGFGALLTGFGAGDRELLEGGYRSVYEAFDITIYYHGVPVAFVDVTGARSVADVRGHECSGYCVGSWKLGKCRRYRVCDRAWVAFVTDRELRIQWLSLRWLDQMAESPMVRRCRLYEDEREALCTDSRHWSPTGAFIDWLRLYGPSHAEA